MSDYTKIKIAIIEDELIIAEDIKSHLESFGYAVSGIATSFDEAIELVTSDRPDIALVDIMIEGIKDGIETADWIKKKINIPVIFLTSHTDKHTVERAKAVKPDGYLVKPFNSRELYTTIEIAFFNYVNKAQTTEPPPSDENAYILNDSLFIKKDHLLVKIRFEELMWIKAEGNYIELHCQNKKYLTRSTLKDFLAKLPQNQFFQIHKSYAVNLKYIDAIEYSSIIIGKENIPLSRTYLDNLKNIIPFDF
jgi:two-component system, LytTR family, response regulator LytT